MIWIVIDFNGAINKFRTCGLKGVKESRCERDNSNKYKAYCYCDNDMCNTNVMTNVSDYKTTYDDTSTTEKITRDNVIARQNTASRQQDVAMAFLLFYKYQPKFWLIKSLLLVFLDFILVPIPSW